MEEEVKNGSGSLGTTLRVRDRRRSEKWTTGGTERSFFFFLILIRGELLYNIVMVLPYIKGFDSHIKLTSYLLSYRFWFSQISVSPIYL